MYLTEHLPFTVEFNSKSMLLYKMFSILSPTGLKIAFLYLLILLSALILTN